MSIRTILLIVTCIGLNGCLKKPHLETSRSMTPTIQPGEPLTTDESAYRRALPARWDVVLINPPPVEGLDPKRMIVRRIVGLPGEELSIREDGIYVGDVRQVPPERISGVRYVGAPTGQPVRISYPYRIPSGSYFLLGDNTANSVDSRFWGTVTKEYIVAKVQDK